MLRVVAAFLGVMWISLADAQTAPIAGNIVGLRGSGFQLQLTTQTCIAPFNTCLGHSTAAQPANQAAINCINECCSAAAQNIHDFVDAQGNHTATGICGTVIGGMDGMQPSAVADGTQFLNLPSGSHSFGFGNFPNGTVFSVTVSNQPTTPSQTCSVNDGFGGVGQPNPTIVVDCEPIFKNGFDP